MPIIQYENLSFAKKESLDIIDRYILPTINLTNKEFTSFKRNRSNTLKVQTNKLDPKIIQLEDYMKEILSSSGKNAYNILFPNGMKDNSVGGERRRKIRRKRKWRFKR